MSNIVIKIPEIARLVYKKDSKLIEKQMRLWYPEGDIRFIYVERVDTEGFLFRKDNTVIMAFAGTNSIKDLWRDLKFFPGAYYYKNNTINNYVSQKMVIHRGFANVINQIQLDVVEAFRDLFFFDYNWVKSVDRVVGIGHSLGASTVYGAVDILSRVFPSILGKTQIRTFGRPNGWSHSAVKAFNDRHPDTINYVNRNDIVTKLLGFSTKAPGKDIILKSKIGIPWVTDHYMDEYLNQWGKV